MDKPTPRVNAGMLGQYTNTTVRLTGRVVKSQGSSLVLETSDSGTLTVHLTPECTVNSEFTEIVGKVQGDGTVSAFTTVDLSSNFGMYLPRCIICCS
ncbi:replication factor A protein 3 [Linderina pennispora]|uniref:Replication factor A protein 3 n=1 Tax=Linderina pennispora TaxID=61395 RepID=A0A1Y1W592_9FUNG|nr:replication factor A protein 3 [Linderina pennispora]ORX68386.1 replication factor A protein 3 [Linderina pennispora]